MAYEKLYSLGGMVFLWCDLKFRNVGKQEDTCHQNGGAQQQVVQS